MSEWTHASRERGLRWRLAAAAAVVALTMVGYRLIGFSADPSAAHVLRTPLDDRIPFLPWTVYVYSWVYTSMLYPLFVVRCSRLFERVVAAYVLVVLTSLATFALFPVTAVGFRPDAHHLDGSVFHNWGVQLTFFVDPPMNLFPSLHMSIAAIAALTAWKARPLFGIVAAPIVLGILVTISTMKQHFVADGLAGLALAAGVYAMVLRPYRPPPERAADGSTAYSWRGPALYVLFHGSVYLALFGLFRLGFRPWDR